MKGRILAISLNILSCVSSPFVKTHKLIFSSLLRTGLLRIISSLSPLLVSVNSSSYDRVGRVFICFGSSSSLSPLLSTTEGLNARLRRQQDSTLGDHQALSFPSRQSWKEEAPPSLAAYPLLSFTLFSRGRVWSRCVLLIVTLAWH